MWLILKWKLKANGPDKRIAAINEVFISGDPRSAALIAETLVRAIDLVKEVSNRPSGAKGDSVRDIIDNANVQRAAADALGQLGDASGIDALVLALNKGSEEFVRIAAARALGRIKNKRAIAPLLSVFPEHRYSWNILGAVATALVDIGDPLVVDSLRSWHDEAIKQRRKQLDDRVFVDDEVSRRWWEEKLGEIDAGMKATDEALSKLGGR